LGHLVHYARGFQAGVLEARVPHPIHATAAGGRPEHHPDDSSDSSGTFGIRAWPRPRRPDRAPGPTTEAQRYPGGDTTELPLEAGARPGPAVLGRPRSSNGSETSNEGDTFGAVPSPRAFAQLGLPFPLGSGAGGLMATPPPSHRRRRARSRTPSDAFSGGEEDLPAPETHERAREAYQQQLLLHHRQSIATAAAADQFQNYAQCQRIAQPGRTTLWRGANNWNWTVREAPLDPGGPLAQPAGNDVHSGGDADPLGPGAHERERAAHGRRTFITAGEPQLQPPPSNFSTRPSPSRMHSNSGSQVTCRCSAGATGGERRSLRRRRGPAGTGSSRARTGGAPAQTGGAPPARCQVDGAGCGFL
jgi:hypothetical protein